jgi:hypothetical protein
LDIYSTLRHSQRLWPFNWILIYLFIWISIKSVNHLAFNHSLIEFLIDLFSKLLIIFMFLIILIDKIILLEAEKALNNSSIEMILTNCAFGTILGL